MKKLGIILIAFALSACSGAKDQNHDHDSLEGGVDVGNVKTSFVPGTVASLGYPSHWSSSSAEDKISIINVSGSSVAASRSDITAIASPDALSLRLYMQQMFPQRGYEFVTINGLEGIRADLVNTKDGRQSDLYLVTELKDVIHIQSDLRSADNGIVEGETIIASIRIKYHGVPVLKPLSKTILFDTKKAEDQSILDSYSLISDCFFYNRECYARGSVLRYRDSVKSPNQLTVDNGRIVEIGLDTVTPYESIRVNGEFLEGPLAGVAIADIYTAFTPNDPHVEQHNVTLRVGYVYLIRSIAWPEEDLITKLKVESIEGSKTTISYQKLVFVPPSELSKQAAVIKALAIKEKEKLISTPGESEIVLYNFEN
ncbi:MAG: hypothetical protein EOP04_27815, partial [Proteobacteria bacterium]